MQKHERMRTLLKLLADKGSVEVIDVARELDVSAATVRRDLDELERQQLVSRTHGGAVSAARAIEIPIRNRRNADAAPKRRIARAAVEMLQRGQVVGLNGGTTTTEVARAIGMSRLFAAYEPWPALTIVTNAVNIAAELTVRDPIKIVVTGGVAKPASFELTGPFAQSVLEEVLIDIAFLGAESLDPLVGAAARFEDEAQVGLHLAARAKTVVIVATSDKFVARGFACMTPVSKINTIITDKLPDPAIVNDFESQGVSIIVA